MILRMTLWKAGAAVSHDIEVVAQPGARVGSLLSALPVPVDVRRCFVGAAALDPHATLADSPLIQGSIISIGTPGPVSRSVTDGDVVGLLEVIRGPDAGLRVALGPGRHTVARSSKASVVLRDTEVSRVGHASLDVAPDGALIVVDLGSSNGTYINGVRILHPTRLMPGPALQMGANELRWVPSSTRALRVTRAPDGRLDFDRAFASVPAVPNIEVPLPVRQTSSQGTATMMGIGALGAVAMAYFTQTPILLLGAVIAGVAYFFTSSQEDKQKAERDKTFTEAKRAAQERIDSQVGTEQQVRHLLAPSPEEVIGAATGARPDLWSRRSDAAHGLTLRVGTADQEAAVTLRGEPWPDFKTPMLRAVPVTVDLRTTGTLGVVGGDEQVMAMLRWLVIQLATLRAPDDLRMVLITAGTGDQLSWMRWLPHVDAGTGAPMSCLVGNTPQTRTARVEELRRLIAMRRAERGGSSKVWFGEEVVVVLDGALALRDLPGMNEVLRDGPAVGVYAICADRRDMSECHGICEVNPTSVRLTRSPDAQRVTATPDRLDAATAEQLARALAPMRDRATLAAAQHAIPDRVRLLDLLEMGVPTADDVLGLWGDGQGPRTRIPLGAGDHGTVYVDIARQGPHTMLGGATGAGKSILLQTLVTSLLLANRPDELNLVLVDFKGGSAFLPFQRCPHVVALIRSTGETANDIFDDAAASRVLASIRAEVSRRESLLARYDGEIDRYWQKRQNLPDLPPLPRLVMIFDEFGRVLDAAPDFIKELVNVAAKGRSLGMHLVLATQSLQGKLSPELKNNVSLRISLRQNEPADSTEVLGIPDAAAIPGSLRGRGMILCTTDEARVPQEFQSGYLGDPPTSGTGPAVVRTVGWSDLGAPRPAERRHVGDAATDQHLAIAAVEQAARRANLTAPFRPLLPALPTALALDELDRWYTSSPPETTVPFGLADEPKLQSQPAEFLDLASSDRLLVAGGPQSGRTTFARTLITSLATRFRPDQAHLYVIEHRPAGLAEYDALPHCGGVFSPAEPDRIRRLITWLAQEVQRRTVARLASANMSRPYVVVVIDGWEHFEDHSDPAFVDTTLVTTLRGVIAAGAPLGVHIIALGGQDMLNHKLPTFYTRRLLLPFPKEDTRRAHLTSGMASPPVLPGRAIEASSGRHVQICQPALAPAQLVTGPHGTAEDVDVAALPRTFPALPTRITLRELVMPESPPASAWFPLGIGGDDNVTIGVDLFETGPHLLLVSGSSGSGRTTAAATAAHGLRRLGIGVLAIASPGSPLPRLLPDDEGVRLLTGVTVKDVELRETAAAFGESPYAVIIDDADHITVLPTEQGFTNMSTLLDEITLPAARGRQALIVTGDAAPVLTGFPSPVSRLFNTILATGVRLLLTPENRAAALAHNIALEPDQYLIGPAGRGYLATGNRVPTLLHLASPVSTPDR
ncbi:FtsK/SpoIIIE domain-containing protein [Micromonospora sp. NPDC003197]